MKGVGRQSFLVIFDFDNTLVDCNTDEVIPAGLGRGDLQRILINEGKIQWTTLIDTLIAPYSREEIMRVARDSVRLDPDMPSVLEYLGDMQNKYNIRLDIKGEDQEGKEFESHYIPQFLEADIVSASNTLFIEASLQAHLPQALGIIRQIHTNPYYEVHSKYTEVAEDKYSYVSYTSPSSISQADEADRDAVYNAQKLRRSRIGWYEPLGDICEGCLELGVQTMCKSKAIYRILSTTSLIDPTIIYVGDGLNDNCPVMSVLRPRDFVFVRRDFPLHKVLSDTLGGCCNVGLWASAKELLQLFQTVLENANVRLPTMARFRDIGEDEFRAITLRNRMLDIVERTISANKEYLSISGRKRLEELKKSLQCNGLVPALPGQRVVPAWLRNYAFVTEHDHYPVKPQDRASSIILREDLDAGDEYERVLPAPRWGQLPWLLGEILFQHVLWQSVMLKEEPAVPSSRAFFSTLHGTRSGKITKQVGVVNLITPYVIHNPLFSQRCKVVPTSGTNALGINSYQTLNTEFLVRMPLETQDGMLIRSLYHEPGTSCEEERQTKQLQCGPTTLPFRTVADPLGDSLLLTKTFHVTPSDHVVEPHADVFAAYRDIYFNEKQELTNNFIKTRVIPILSCEPWAAPLEFVEVLLRWMLWANGLDLSMFTLQDLRKTQTASHNQQDGAHLDQSSTHKGVTAEERVANLRAAEADIAKVKDEHILGNDLNRVAQHIKSLLLAPRDGSGAEYSSPHHCDGRKLSQAATLGSEKKLCQIDIVMDNVGVECIADLCFGLWFIEQASANSAVPGTVVYHVKSHPYYVSDVTPSDFDATLFLLENYCWNCATDNTLGDAEKEVIRNALEPFITRVRTAFAEGRFCLDADTAWTQPCEYRDLPPRLINRYFFTQRVTKTRLTVGEPLTVPAEAAKLTATEIFRQNKEHFSAKTSLVIFKGDLNYRRVVGDRYWDRDDFMTSLGSSPVPTSRLTPLADLQPTSYATASSQGVDAAEEMIQDTPEECSRSAPSFQDIVSAYWPTHLVPVCCIRTIKSENCVGVTQDKKEFLNKVYSQSKSREGCQNSDSKARVWSLTGKEGLIVLAN